MVILIYYKKTMPNGSIAMHYVNFGRVENFTVTDSDSETLLYANTGNDIHTLNEGKKILNVKKFMTRLAQFSDMYTVDVASFIDDWNAVEKQKSSKGLKFS